MSRSGKDCFLSPLKWIIFYYGIELCEKSSKQFLVSLLLRLKSLLLMTYSVIITLHLCINVRPMYVKISEFNLYIISYHIKTLLVLITFLNFIYNSNQIRSILADLDKELNEMAKKRMKVFSLISFFACLITSVTTALLFSVSPIIEGWSLHVSIREFIWGTTGLLWIFSSHFFLITICYGIHQIERHTFCDIINTSYEVINFHPDFEEMHTKILDIQRIKERINQYLGFLPLLWFGQTFISAVLRLAHVSMSHLDDVHFVDLFYEFILIILHDLFYLFAINYFQSQRPTANQLMTSLGPIGSDFSRNLKIMIVQNSIISYTHTEYKAWNIFTIDKTFLFTFLGTIITFSVMFIQLIEGK